MRHRFAYSLFQRLSVAAELLDQVRNDLGVRVGEEPMPFFFKTGF